jgi:hypothetical protein
MKIITGLAIAVMANEKKVPPRSPTQRLSTLRRFMSNFANEVAAPIAGDGYAGRLEKRMHGMVDSMGRAYERPTCGFYDPNTKHGGPDPNPEIRPNGKPRNRRFAAEDMQEDLEAECAKGWDGINETLQAECCAYSDSFASANSANCNAIASSRSGGRGKKDPWDRLSSDPALKWKQIMTGCRKWAERYIGNCAGQRKNKLIKNRTKRVFGKVNEKLGLA